MGVVTDTVVSAGMAVGNVVATERDRPAQDTGRVDQRVKKRVAAVVTDGATKTAASVGAPHLAREVAKRLGHGLIGRVAAGLAAHPAAAAGAALLVVDVVRDAARVASGKMKPSQAVEHLGASTTGLLGGAGGVMWRKLAGLLFCGGGQQVVLQG